MSDIRELVENLYSELVREGSVINVSRGGVINVDGERLTQKSTLEFLQGRARKAPTYAPLLLVEVVPFLAMMRIVHQHNTRVTPPDYSDVDVRNYSYDGLIPFQSVTDGTRYCLFDTRTGSVTDLDFKTFKENRETAEIEPIKGRIEFNPYSPVPLASREDAYGRPCNFLNTYKKPAWQLDEELTPEKASNYAPPKIFAEFLIHLIPDKGCRDFVLDWLHFALTDRCETYLVLNGKKGVGKGLLAEQFCKALMGANNHKLAQPSALNSDFNALLKDCRMIVFDEFRVDTPEKVNKLKRYVNEEQMIERKGIDVAETSKTFNSFMISNNDEADMKISWDDRRFSVVDLTHTKLQDAWTKTKIDELMRMFGNEKDMRAVGYWLMYRKPKHTKFDAWKGHHFFELCYSSFSEWQKVIVDLVTSKQYREITNADMKKEYRKRTEATRVPGYSRIKDFVENYRHESQWSLGEIYKEAHDVWVLHVSEQFAGGDALEDNHESLLG